MVLHFPGLIQCNICYFPFWVTFLIYKMKVRLDLFHFFFFMNMPVNMFPTDNRHFYKHLGKRHNVTTNFRYALKISI